MLSKHAILGASSAHQWLNCPPSIRLTEGMPDTAGPAAAEGTLAHAVGELKLRKHYTPMGPRQFSSALKKLKAERDQLEAKHGADKIGPWSEMERATDDYLDVAKEIALGFSSTPYVALEQRVDFSQWVPEGFGTADTIIIGDGVLHVIDFKYGKGVQVGAEDNPQMRLYALGAYRRYQLIQDIQQVRMSIFQPRNGGLSHAEKIPIDDLLKWAEEFVTPRASLAFDGKGDFAPGDWCRFCKVRSTCRARSDHNLALEGFQAALPPLLTDAEVGDALLRAQQLKGWLSSLEEYALSALLAGKKVAGWKAVEGRAVRAWTDQEAAFKAAVEAGIEEAILYKRVPVTLAALEKDIGKKAFAPLVPYIATPPGKPALAPESDRRPAITNRPSAQEDFGNAPINE